MKRLALLLVLAACGPRPPAAVPVDNGAPPPAPRPIGPGPKVNWIGDHFETVGLPAMSKDGSKFVYAYQGEDGARGQPNLSLVVKDPSDAAVNELVVMKADEEEVSEGKLEDANRYLADGQSAYQWSEMVPAEVEEGTATVGGLVLSFTMTGHLVIKDGDQVLLERDYPGWLAPKSSCDNPAFLSDAWVAVERGGALIKISYRGTDTCWEPDSTMHVVTWK